MRTVTSLFRPGVADWEFGVVLALLRDTFGFRTRVATPDGRGVQSSGGVRIEADTSFDTVDYRGDDLILVIGSDDWVANADPALEARLKARADAGRPLAAICAGTLPLARAGVLNDRAHTSNALDFLTQNAPGYTGEAHYRDVRQAVRDGMLVTAAAPMPLSFACAAAAMALPDKAAEIEAFWNMVRAEGQGDIKALLG